MRVSVQAFLCAAVICCLLIACQTSKKEGANSKPNIIIFYVDDLGYGDVGVYGAKHVSTPNVDALANGGIKFTDGHCTSATCTPSRYSLLTGSYAFRNNAAILPGDAPLLIDTAMVTLPKMLKSAGYKTSVVGKWHLGLGNGDLNWNKSISPGPLEVGFDYSFLIPATGDRVPTVYVEDHYVVNLDDSDPLEVSYGKPIGNEPTGISNPELLRVGADHQHAKTIVNGVSRIGYMTGGEKARWVDEDFADILTDKSIEVIDQSGEKPFFLYYSFHDIHVPRLPHDRFQGASDMGPRGDAIAQMDWCVGNVVDALKERGIFDNTLIIFSSDNGPVLFDGYYDSARYLVADHLPAGPYRGGKYSAFEGGTRVPTIVSWPDKIAPSESDALVSQVDLLRTLATVAGAKLSETAGLDSQDETAAWLGQSKEGRQFMVEESETLSLRMGNWKYIKPAPGKRKIASSKNIETGNAELDQLYDLSRDPGEQANLAAESPDVVSQMAAKLDEIINQK